MPDPKDSITMSDYKTYRERIFLDEFRVPTGETLEGVMERIPKDVDHDLIEFDYTCEEMDELEFGYIVVIINRWETEEEYNTREERYETEERGRLEKQRRDDISLMKSLAIKHGIDTNFLEDD